MTRRATSPAVVHYPVSRNGQSETVPARIVPDMVDPDELQRRYHQVSIVIPVLNDPRIFNCIDSIDAPGVEIVIVSNGSSPSFNAALEERQTSHIRVETTPIKGIGRAYNIGIAAASRPWILLVDADCTFYPASIAAMCSGMHTADFVRGRVDFATTTLTTRIPARARRFTEDGRYSGKVTAYSPPLLYRKDVVREMGGYHFHDALEWREDREFELRRRAASIPIAFAPLGAVRHAALTIRADLRSVRAYGRSETLGRRAGLFPREPSIARLRKTVATMRRVAIMHRAPDTAFYIALRRLIFNFGRAQGSLLWPKPSPHSPSLISQDESA